MRPLALLLAVSLCGAALPGPGAAAEGFVTTPSATNFKTTLAKLGAAIRSRNFTLFAEVDHAAGAAGVGLSLRPTHLIIFGNPRGGTPPMACAQSFGLDLPLKALVYEDAAGKTVIATPDPAAMATRHALGDCAKPAIETMGKALQAIAMEAAAP